MNYDPLAYRLGACIVHSIIQGNMRVRRYSHLQLHVAVPAYSQVTHSVRVTQVECNCSYLHSQIFCKYRSGRYSQFTRSHTCSLLATQKVPLASAILSYNMIKCSATSKSLVPTRHTLRPGFWGCGEFRPTFFERQLWPVLVLTCTLLARYLPLLAVD